VREVWHLTRASSDSHLQRHSLAMVSKCTLLTMDGIIVGRDGNCRLIRRDRSQLMIVHTSLRRRVPRIQADQDPG
jgi:hypothetical protein